MNPGHPPQPLPAATGPGTLQGALLAEAEGLGSVRFKDGRPVWLAGAIVRFVVDTSATSEFGT